MRNRLALLAAPALATLVAVAPTPAAPQPAPTRPSRADGTWIAKVLAPTAVHERLGGRGVSWIARPQTLYNGLAQRLMVLQERSFDGRRWLQVRLPIRPNDAKGWIARDAVILERTDWWIDLRLGRRELRAYRGGHLRRRARVVIGAPATPTPRGLFAVYEIAHQPNPAGFLGPWALHLTANSDVLDNFGGGTGRVALHGRSGASLRDPLGSARSHGCVRMNNDVIRWLAARVPAGTPVRVRP